MQAEATITHLNDGPLEKRGKGICEGCLPISPVNLYRGWAKTYCASCWNSMGVKPTAKHP